MGDELETIVQRMIDAGEPEDAIASVIREYQPTTSARALATPRVAAGLGAAKAIPAVVSGVNKGASFVSAVDPVVASIVGSVASPTGAAIGAAVPKAASVVETATAAPGILARGAGMASRVASKGALPLTLASGTYDTFNAIQEAAKRLEDPTVSEREKQAIRLALSGGFAQ